MKKILTISIHLIFIVSCGGKFSVLPKSKRLNHPVKEQTEIEGSLVMVSDGIMVLLREEQNYIKRTILIASNDSVNEIAECSYETRIDNGCRIGVKSWISFNGNYLKKDSIQPIFQFSQVKVLDDGSTCSIISEE